VDSKQNFTVYTTTL